MITFFTGPMFAGKTSEAIRVAEATGKTVGYFKAPGDTRHEGIGTHNGKMRAAVELRNMTDFARCAPYDVCVVDELQFFGPFIIPLMRELCLNGKEVLVTGLDRWHDGAVPERVVELTRRTGARFVRLTAFCANGCEAPATRTGKFVRGGDRVEVGGSDLYIPLCIDCWNKMYMTEEAAQ